MWDTTQAGLKRRMDERLKQLGKPMTELAEETGDDYKNVQRWISGTQRVPATFVARYAAAVSVDPRWLLTGEGVPDPQLTESDARETLAIVAALIRNVLRRRSPGSGLDEPGALEVERIALEALRRRQEGVLGSDQSATGNGHPPGPQEGGSGPGPGQAGAGG